MERLGSAIEDWMVRYKSTSVKPATYDRLYESLIQLNKYDISDVALDELTVDDLQSYINELVASGYALTTIKKQYHLISEYLTYANLNGIILRPLHKGVRLPSESVVKKHKRSVVAYNREEQSRLTTVLFQRLNVPACCAALLMMETGIRIGEAMALTWDDVDWNRRSLRVSKTVVRLRDCKRNHVQYSAKSFSSNRTIPLSRRAYDLLKHMHEEDGYSLYGYVFRGRDGKYMSYEAARCHIQKACEDAGVPYYGQHVFRHTFATNCYNKGCDVKILSKFLGHSDVTVTYNTYIHLFGDGLEEMRSVLD